MFDPEGDVLREQLGVDGPAGDQRRPAADGRHRVLERRRRAAPPSRSPRTTPAHSSRVSIEQTEKVTPNDGGTIGFESGAPGAALSGFTEKSAKGVQRVIGVQLLFYVPSVGSDEQIRLLGWSESLIGASEVP